MLEWKRSQDGLEVPVLNGQSLGSLRAAKIEAEKWLARSESQIHSSGSIIVLGLGCGWHLNLLAEKYPDRKILVFDFFSEILSGLKKANQVPQGLNVIFLSDADDVFESARMKDILAERPPVLQYGPAKWIAVQMYDQLQMNLTARNPRGREHFQETQFQSINENQAVWSVLGELIR